MNNDADERMLTGTLRLYVSHAHHSVTVCYSAAVTCQHRDSNGVCPGDAPVSVIQAAYYSFQVAAGDVEQVRVLPLLAASLL
jgi:hypothetical protein